VLVAGRVGEPGRSEEKVDAACSGGYAQDGRHEGAGTHGPIPMGGALTAAVEGDVYGRCRLVFFAETFFYLRMA
jgi:hypothetical protein